jgi:hypothetical protein
MPKISELTEVTSPASTAVVPVVDGGVTKKVTLANLVTASGGGGGAGTPGGSNTQVQFNDSSAFGGDSGLTYNKTSNVLTAAGGIATGADPSTWNNGIDLSHNQSIASRNSTDDDDVTLLGLIADTVTIGDPGYDVVIEVGTGRDLILRSDTTKLESGNGSNGGVLEIPEAGAEPGVPADGAFVYVDPADGLVKWKAPDGTVREVGFEDEPLVLPVGAVAGDLLYYDGANLERIPIGTAGQVLTVNATADGYEWTAGGGGPGSYDPAVLALTGWWRASFTSSPWGGTASAGSSASEAISEGTNPPSTGAAVNGLTPADFDGTNDRLLADIAGSIDDFYNAAAYSGWALVYADAITTDSTTPYDNDAIVSTQGASFAGVYLRSSGLAGIYHYDTGWTKVETAFTTGAWHLVQWKYDGVNLKIRVDSGSWASVAAGSINTVTNRFVFGENWNAGAHFNGKLLEFATIDSALSDATFDDIITYVNDEYALSL